MSTTELRQSAQLIWEAALHAANPATCIRNYIRLHEDVLTIGREQIPIRGRIIVIGTGKPCAKMAQAVEELLNGYVSDGLVVTKYGHSLPLERIRLIEAGHPIPDA